MRMYRQGDVLIVETRQHFDEYAVQTDNVLVYGEFTGHAHRVVGDNVVVLNLHDNKVIDATKAFKVVHEEHDTIEIPEGRYRVIRQREYDEEHVHRYVSD